MYNSHILSGDKTTKVNYGPQHLAPTTRAIAMLSGALKDCFQGFFNRTKSRLKENKWDASYIGRVLNKTQTIPYKRHISFEI